MLLAEMIHGPSCSGSAGLPETSPSSMMPHAGSALSTGSPIAIKLFVVSPSYSGSMTLSCPLSRRKPFALPKVPLLTCLRHQMRVGRRLSANPRVSTTSASAKSQCRRMLQEGCISSSATSTRQRIFPPGKCWPGRFRRRTSRGRLFLSGPVLLACSTCGQPQSMRRCPESIFTPRYSSI